MVTAETVLLQHFQEFQPHTQAVVEEVKFLEQQPEMVELEEVEQAT
jgi:hypothetical protein